MSGHTPGPWVVNGFGGHFEPVCRLVPSGVLVSAETNRGDEIATARLIAAAPELLEALYTAQGAAEALEALRWDSPRLKELTPGIPGVLNKIRAAIAKAEGR